MASQFAHKQPTRFNEPEIPQDLATKGYVDGQTHVASYIIGTQIIDTIANAATEFTAPFVRLAWNTTSSIRRMLMPVTAIVNNLTVQVSANTKNGEFIITVVNDLINGNGTITVASLATGKFQDLVNSDTIVGNDFLQFEGDSTASSTGTANINSINLRCVSL